MCVCQIIWNEHIGRKCGPRTLCDAEPEPIGEVNKRLDQSRQKTIQHLRLLLLRVASIGCEVRPEVVRGRENEILKRLCQGVAL